MQLGGSVALVTGANRGLGRAFVEALLQAGASKVYAATRNPRSIAVMPRVVPIPLDVTDLTSVHRAGLSCQDVSVLVNNAGVMHSASFLGGTSLLAAAEEMQTNYFGPLAMCQEFAPILARNGGGAIVNMLSVVSWFTNPMRAGYCASKAAALALTEGIRIELRAQKTLVMGVFAGFVDTDMVAALDVEKVTSRQVAAQAITGLIADAEEVLADERSRTLNALLVRRAPDFQAQMQDAWDRRA